MLNLNQADSRSAVDRLNEIAEILAAGLTRLEARKSSRMSADFGESSLHFTPEGEELGSNLLRALDRTGPRQIVSSAPLDHRPPNWLDPAA
jgi:hypothetical protein